ncbi:MAG: trypsin-like peptidase domain-containing protein [Actinomycetota bacterium]|nr:trypsin-like peptidase domain-containing protein [Actinomycetota bacterium]
MTAAVLAGALVLGGAAGIGGAAWHDAWIADSPSTPAAAASATTSSGNQIHESAASATAASSVEGVAARVLPSVVQINVSGANGSGSGSGIILNKTGEILTNNHVIALAGSGGSVTVSFNGGKTLRAQLVGTDPVTDVAVIKAQGATNLRPATIGSSESLRVGQSVVAVGSPYGLSATVTSGIVSALNRPVSVATSQPQAPKGGSASQSQLDPSTTYPAIQTDAAINPGNSGGPLVDMAGRVVGINSSIRTADSTSSGSQGGSIGLGFAIPIKEVLPIVNQILNHQTPTHARLGVTVSDVPGKRLEQGAVIRSLESTGAGHSAGLRAGDVITRVDNQIISGADSLVATIRGHRPGDQVQLTIVRGAKTMTVTANLGSDAGTKTS